MRFDHCAVHYHCAHAYQCIIAQGTSVYDGIVCYRYVAAYVERMFLVCGVKYRTVLYVDFVPHFYVVHVAAHDGAEPYVAVVAHSHVAQYRCVVCEPASVSVNRGFAPHFLYYSHFLYVFYPFTVYLRRQHRSMANLSE